MSTTTILKYKTAYTKQSVTSYKNTREQVVPEPGLVFTTGASFYIYHIDPPDETTQGFPASFKAYRVFSVNHLTQEVYVDASITYVHSFSPSKKRDVYHVDLPLRWGVVTMVI
jgi:hypothetical protein